MAALTLNPDRIDETAESACDTPTGQGASEGSVLVITVVVVILSFIAGCLAIDFGRITLAKRSLIQAAEEAALSGATAFLPGKRAALDVQDAKRYAADNLQKSIANGYVKATNIKASYNVTQKKVTVTLTGNVKDLIFINAIYRWFGNNTPTVQVTGRSSAEICVAQEGIGGDGRCSRPDLSQYR